MSENKYKVVVTRAPRMDLTPYNHAKAGDICVAANGNIGVKHYNEFIFLRKTEGSCMWADGLVFIFADFDEAAKWVANGRKLEDLQGDAKDEFMTLTDLPTGIYAKVIDNKGFGAFKWGDIVMIDKNAKGVFSLVDGDSAHFYTGGGSPTGLGEIIVWPVNPALGDRIEIVPAT